MIQMRLKLNNPRGVCLSDNIGSEEKKVHKLSMKLNELEKINRLSTQNL